MLFCRGIGRKLAVPILIVSMLGWLAYVIGFAAFNNRENYYNDYRTSNETLNISRAYFLRADDSLPAQRADLFWFPHWCVLIMGPFTYLCSIIHLIVGRFFTGIFTKFLTAVFMATGGAVSYATGLLLFSDSHSSLQYVLSPDNPNWLTDEFYGLWHILEFAGCLTAVFFMALFMTMWPFFSEPYAEEYEEYEEEDKEENA